MDDETNFRTWLPLALEKSGLSIAEAARLSGVSKATLHRLLSADYKFMPAHRTEKALRTVLQPLSTSPHAPDIIEEWRRGESHVDTASGAAETSQTDRDFVLALRDQLAESVKLAVARSLDDPEFRIIRRDASLPGILRLAFSLQVIGPEFFTPLVGFDSIAAQAQSDSEFKLDERVFEELRLVIPGPEVDPLLIRPQLQIWASTVEIGLISSNSEEAYENVKQAMVKGMAHIMRRMETDKR